MLAANSEELADQKPKEPPKLTWEMLENIKINGRYYDVRDESSTEYINRRANEEDTKTEAENAASFSRRSSKEGRGKPRKEGEDQRMLAEDVTIRETVGMDSEMASNHKSEDRR